MAELLAGWPDTSGTQHHATGAAHVPRRRRHIQAHHGAAGCSHRTALVDVGPARLVPVEERCQREGCRGAWPEVDRG
jgi:hypothetical protein